MKKIVLFSAFVTLAFVGTSPAQQLPTPTSSSGEHDSGDLIAAHRPTPKPVAKDSGGKKMVGDIALATDEKGKNATASFPAGTTTVYLVTKNVSGAKGDKVRVDWIADDAGKALPKGKRFNSSAVDLPDTGSYNPNFHVTGPGNKAIPAGKYHVDVFVGSEKLKSAQFVVK